MSQYGATQPKIRLMDLAAELGLQIAEYALAQDEPFKWHWTTYQPDKKVGSFKSIEKLTALCRVSRKFYAESSKIVWKANALAFEWIDLGDAFHAPAAGSATFM